jgi:hypothetical protein
MKLSNLLRGLATLALVIAFYGMSFAQGVTTSSMNGVIKRH